MTRIRILLADDHAILRSGVRMLINAQDDMEVVGEAADGEQAIALAAKLSPDIALVDINMPGTSGIQAIEQIVKRSPTTRVLALTMYDDAAYVRSVLGAGGVGYVVKRAADSELLSAIRTVSQGRSYIDVSLAGGGGLTEIVQPAAAPKEAERKWSDARLSQREREVLQLVAHGYTNQEVADRLGLSVKTIETYRARVAEKVGLRTRADLVRYALEMGLLGTDAQPPVKPGHVEG